MAFNKILVANRGEIAVRVMSTAHAMGYRTVAVYTQADAAAPHVALADEAVCIGNGPVGESYLSVDKILDAAHKTGADALHPGYGFLSENGAFAETCEQAGIVFIGPDSQAITLMGSKRQSKIAMQAAGVPCIPGYEGEDQRDEALLAEGKTIGFPLMVKASAGGGGRGMRLVHEEAQLEESLRTARSEAQSAFGSGELILEKAIMQPRHIEIQVFADQYGNTVYLGERDCSIQRRHQKVVEEAPSPFVDAVLRARMGEAAVAAAQACQYRGAGTVEFLVDDQKNFYFLEMNTRLQVEHPVTEWVTGLDLVEWQLRVAAGEPLPLQQNEITLNGHAMEVRLYAEDPRNQFMPQTGKVLRWQPAEGEGVRVDGGIQQGQTISAFYDPMLAKIITRGANREEARRRLVRAVEDTLLLGVNHNKQFLSNVLQNSVFVNGDATTDFIEVHFNGDSSMATANAAPQAVAIAALLLVTQNKNEQTGWSNSAPLARHFCLQFHDSVLEVSIKKAVDIGGASYAVQFEEQCFHIELSGCADGELIYVLNDVRRKARFHMAHNFLYISCAEGDFQFEDLSNIPKATTQGAGSGAVLASMDGAIVSVAVQSGETVSRGQTLVVLEAMKMEHQLKADAEGTVTNILVATGDQVKGRQLLVEIDVKE